MSIVRFFKMLTWWNIVHYTTTFISMVGPLAGGIGLALYQFLQRSGEWDMNIAIASLALIMFSAWLGVAMFWFLGQIREIWNSVEEDVDI